MSGCSRSARLAKRSDRRYVAVHAPVVDRAVVIALVHDRRLDRVQRTPIAELPEAFQIGAFNPGGFQTGAVEVNLRGTLDVEFVEGEFDAIATLEEFVTNIGHLLKHGQDEFKPGTTPAI